MREEPMVFERTEASRPLLHEELSGLIRQTAFEVHQYFGPGSWRRSTRTRSRTG
jgi:hypothetical protein